MTDDVKDMDDLASSADQADVNEAVASPEDAISSTATPSVDAESDLLEVVRDVVQQEDKSAEAAAPQAESEEVAENPDEAEPEKEDGSDLPFGKHPRFKQILNERNAFKADAQNYRNVQNFIDQQGLPAEEAAEGLVIMGLMKTNPAEAWARMKPMVQKLLVAAGEVLPDDLKQTVQRGEMSASAALEVSRSRAAVQSTQAQRQFEQQRSEQSQVEQTRASLVNAANEWEAGRRRADPNFDAKFEPLQDRVYALQRREGIPNTPQGVQDQLNRAYREVAAPAPRPATPAAKPAVTPIRGGQVAGNQAPQAGSTMDVVQQVLARRGS